MLLWRRPGVLAAVAGGCVVLAASAAAVPLFLSSAGTGAVAVQARARCPRDTGGTVARAFAVPGVDIAPADDTGPSGPAPELSPAQAPPDPFAGLDGLAPADLSFTLGAGLLGATGDAETEVVLLARDGAIDHVERLEGTAGPGVWVSDRGASATGLAPGDTATLVVDVSPVPPRGTPRNPRFARVEVPVAGVYRDLTGLVQDDYWCSHTRLLALEGLDPVAPPPVVLLDRATLVDLAASLGVGVVAGEWEAPLVLDELTLADAGDLAAALGEGPPGVETHLPFVADRARAIRTAVAGACYRSRASGPWRARAWWARRRRCGTTAGAGRSRCWRSGASPGRDRAQGRPRARAGTGGRQRRGPRAGRRPGRGAGSVAAGRAVGRPGRRGGRGRRAGRRRRRGGGGGRTAGAGRPRVPAGWRGGWAGCRGRWRCWGQPSSRTGGSGSGVCRSAPAPR